MQLHRRVGRRALAAVVMAFIPLLAAAFGVSAQASADSALSTPAQGYRLVSSTGEVRSFGIVPTVTGPTGSFSKPVVGMAGTSDGQGYWLATSNGSVTNYGSAPHIAVTQLPLNKPMISMVATPSFQGLWLVASDGGVFSYGNAKFYGSTGNITLNKPVVGMATTPSGNGYWMVASDGGVFSYGDAHFYGSTGAMKLNKPVVGMASTPSGNGYWLVASDGGIFAFGDAYFYGSTGAMKLNKPINSLALSPSGSGYWLVASDGGVFSYGDAHYAGSGASPTPMHGSVVAAKGFFTTGSLGANAAQFAMNHLGDAYVTGGNGPNAWDCSGLVMAAFGSTGISLPRIAQDQFNAGPHISLLEPLQIGDLVFYGSSATDIQHVGIYIGNGQMVNAPHTGAVVRVENYRWSGDDYVGATRPAG